MSAKATNPFSNWPTAFKEEPPAPIPSGTIIGVVDLSKRPRIYTDDAARTRYFIDLQPETLPTIGPFATCGAALRWLREKFGDDQVNLWMREWVYEKGGQS